MINNILDIQALNVSFAGFQVLNNLQFSMQPNELRCLVGPNGAGKTTLLDVLTGKTKANGGNITFAGNIDLTKKPAHKVAQMGIARKFQTTFYFCQPDSL